MQAIGFTIVASGVKPEVSSSVLEAQLSRYQAQLADWCSCPSGKTPAGKEKIQELQNKVDAVKAQLQRVATTQAQRQSSAERANRSPNPGTAGNAAQPGLDKPGDLPLSAARRFTGTSIGGWVDAFA